MIIKTETAAAATVEEKLSGNSSVPANFMAAIWKRADRISRVLAGHLHSCRIAGFVNEFGRWISSTTTSCQSLITSSDSVTAGLSHLRFPTRLLL